MFFGINWVGQYLTVNIQIPAQFLSAFSWVDYWTLWIHSFHFSRHKYKPKGSHISLQSIHFKRKYFFLFKSLSYVYTKVIGYNPEITPQTKFTTFWLITSILCESSVRDLMSLYFSSKISTILSLRQTMFPPIYSFSYFNMIRCKFFDS